MPPRIASSTRSAKRRSSSRAIAGPPSVRWYCSVSRTRKRVAGAGRARAARGAAGGGLARRRRPGTPREAHSTTWSCSTMPAAAITTFAGT